MTWTLLPARRHLSPGARVDLALEIGGYAHLRRFWPRTDPVDVIVVATWEEAFVLGARRRGGVLVDLDTGARYLSVAAGPRAIEGLRVGEVLDWTPAALTHRNARQLGETLVRSQLKARR